VVGQSDIAVQSLDNFPCPRGTFGSQSLVRRRQAKSSMLNLINGRDSDNQQLTEYCAKPAYNGGPQVTAAAMWPLTK
jgi:hypothetical protein